MKARVRRRVRDLQKAASRFWLDCEENLEKAQERTPKGGTLKLEKGHQTSSRYQSLSVASERI